MLINRDNYEIFFVDFIDGNLSPSQEIELREFLDQNHDLAAELYEIENINLEPSEIAFPKGHAVLKKDLQWGIDDRLDYLCIAKIEGDISDDEEKELQQYLNSDIEANSILANFKKARLTASTNTIYPIKSAIKRIGLVNLTYKRFYTIGSSVAAASIIIFGLTIGLSKFMQLPEQQLATTSSNTIVVEEKTEAIDIEKIIETPTRIERQPIETIKNDRQTKQANEPSEKIIDLAQQERVGEKLNNEIKIISRIEIAAIPQKVTVDDNKMLLSLASTYASPEPQALNKTGRNTSGVREIGLFELAQMGFNRLSDATGKTLNLAAKKDDEGKIQNIYFDSELFALSVPVRRKK